MKNSEKKSAADTRESSTHVADQATSGESPQPLEYRQTCGEAGQRSEAESIVDSVPSIGSLDQRMDAVATDVRACLEQITKLAAETARLRTDDRVLTEISARHRELSEQHHERDFLNPVFHAQIRMADRCRQNTAKLEEILAKQVGSSNRAVILATRAILEAREADRVEIESLLANYGVEPFENPGVMFDPAVQKCIRREGCDDPGRHGQIARRLLPGYKRYDKVLRKEYVNAYVPSDSQGRICRGDAK